MAAGQTRENAEQLVGLDAECARGKAKLASLTDEQREQVDQFFRELVAEFARRTPPRRAGLRPCEAFDFRPEWEEAHRHATRVAVAAQPAPSPQVPAPRRPIAKVASPRERRDSGGRRTPRGPPSDDDPHLVDPHVAGAPS
jgi:hypothetical protein